MNGETLVMSLKSKDAEVREDHGSSWWINDIPEVDDPQYTKTAGISMQASTGRFSCDI